MIVIEHEEELIPLLKQGVEIWNEWRKNNPTGRLGKFFLNFSGVDLNEINLSGADLSDVIFTSANLGGVNFGGANLHCAALWRANLSMADLSGGNLEKFDLTGTNFNGANLSGTNLSEAKLNGANLSGTNLSEAKLNGANLSEAKLNGANLKGATLRFAKLQNVDLSGADLSGADLSMTDFSEANLSGADLSNADLSKAELNADLNRANLSGANLFRTQALSTNFNQAIFTRACIEDWHTNSLTNLNDVICDYVYLRQGQQERRPSSGNFTLGEFTKLFQKALETVDLIFRNGVDWDAFAYSFQKVKVESSGVQLDVQSLEKKGDGVFVVRVSVSPDADKARIHNDFMQGYHFAHEVLSSQYQARLEDKEKYINQLFFLLNQTNENQCKVIKRISESPKYDMRKSSFSGGFAEKKLW